MGIQEHSVGKVRYFTIYLTFPDGVEWCDQLPFVHDLQFQLSQTKWEKKHPGSNRDLLTKGETSFYEGLVKHTIRIEEEKRERIWGIKK